MISWRFLTQFLVFFCAIEAWAETGGAVALAMGIGHSLVLKDDGSLWGTGANDKGQLGIGSLEGKNSLVPIASEVVAVSAGNAHSAFLKADGSLWVMGWNGRGQLGNGNTIDQPMPILLATEVLAVAAGGAHTAFIKTDHTLWSVGANDYGQSGQAIQRSQLAPAMLAEHVVAVAAGAAFTLFLKDDGTLWGVGDNSSGQLRYGEAWSQARPLHIASGVTGMEAGAAFHLFTKSDGSLWSMGDNSSGQIAVGVPQPRQLVADAVTLAADFNHSYHTRANGTLIARGFLALGSNTFGSSTVTVDNQVMGLAAGSSPAALLYSKQDGSLWAIGENGSGQLGDGTTISRTAPVQVLPGFTRPPAPPVGLTASAGTMPNAVVLSWAPIFGASYYEIWRSATDNFSDAVLRGRATAPLFPDTQTTLGTTYHYWLRAIGPGGSSVFSSAADGFMSSTVAIPAITTQPADRSTLGEVATTMAITVSSAAPVSYQWQQLNPYEGIWKDMIDGEIYSGTQMAELTILLPNQALKVFRCIVTNSAGAVVSSYGTLSIIIPPTIAIAPVDASATAGAGAVLSATVDSYPSPVLQWQRCPAGSSTWQNLEASADVHVHLSTAEGSASGKITLCRVTPAMNGDRFRVIGSNSGGTVTSDPVSLTVDNTGVIQVLATAEASYFLKSNGTLWVTGRVNESYPSLLASEVVRLDASSGHTLMLKADGTLWGLGSNAYGQLGDGTTTASSTYKLIASEVIYMSAGDYQTAFIKRDGSLWRCGRSLVPISGSPPALSPEMIAPGVGFVAAGETQLLYITLDGALQGLGYGGNAQVPPNDGIHPALHASNVVFATRGSAHTLFLTADNGLWGMGSTTAGQLGVNHPYAATTVPVPIAPNVFAAAATSMATFFIRNDGTLWLTGDGVGAWFGFGNNPTKISLPVQAAADVRRISANTNHAMLIRSDGSLWATGGGAKVWLLGTGPFSGHPSSYHFTSPVMITAGVATIPATPTGLIVTDAVSSRIRLAWNHAIGAETYEVWRGDTNNSATANRIVADLFAPIYEDRDVAVGNSYFYWIKAVNSAGASSWSNAGVGEEGIAGAADPVITAQPPAFFTPSGSATTVSITASSGSALTYQWQWKTYWDGGWSAVPTNEFFSQANTATLTINEAGRRYLDVLGYWYRCVVTGDAGSVASTAAQFVATDDPQITWPNPAPITYGTLLGSMQLNATAQVAGTFSYSPSVGTLLGGGTQTLTTTFTPSVSDYKAVTLHRTVRVQRAGQSIVFSALADRDFSTEPQALNGSASSGLALSFRVIEGPATITGSTLVLTGAGTVTVRASQAGDANHLFADNVDRSFTVHPVPATITLGSLAATYDGAPKPASATTVPAGLAVDFTYDGSATIPSNAGTYAVAATIHGTGYQGSAAGSLTIAKAAQAVTFGTLPDRPYTWLPLTLTASASSGLPVTFTVLSGPATVAGNKLTLTSLGTVSVRAEQNGNDNYLSASPVDRSFVITAGLSSWQAEHFTSSELANAAISGPNADPDGDGLPNLVEYALGLGPKQADAAGLPEVSVTATDWVYTYTRPEERGDILYVVEASTDLADWNPAGVTHTKVSTNGGVETWQATYPLGSAANVFFRLKVVED